MGLEHKHPLGLGRTGREGRHGWHLAGGGPRRLEGRAGPASETPARALSRGPAESHQRHCVDSCGGRLRTWHRDSGHTTSGSSGPAPADDVTAPCGRSRDRGARGLPLPPPGRASASASSRMRVPVLAHARAKTS